jgi:hypothetical protein
MSAASANPSDNAVDPGIFLIEAQPRIRVDDVHCGWLVVSHRRRPRHGRRFHSCLPWANGWHGVGRSAIRGGCALSLMLYGSNTCPCVGDIESIGIWLVPRCLCKYGSSNRHRQNDGHAEKQMFSHGISPLVLVSRISASDHQTVVGLEIFLESR